MATIHEKIVEKLVAELINKKSLSAEKINALQSLLKTGGKLRSDDLIELFSRDDGDVV
ncbi:hypothetical protein I6F18_34625 [Bradyrhizobium sp. NBAIM32]|uniref:hypothetical protein n=1 Tax=Bradyrhizobium sp. NBAIM32 TaxID=2793809 RepID=UPI001CD767C1|nr:hypothetical protein [Bradyrhizobium sp. NBAIM32]MCA1545024.1 hypothetical protein [Bradyrhizobium sp. NBAIM32]